VPTNLQKIVKNGLDHSLRMTVTWISACVLQWARACLSLERRDFRLDL